MIKLLIMRLLHNDIFLADYRTAFKYPTCEILKDLAVVSYFHGTSFQNKLHKKLNGDDFHA